eukprot:COSAG01_NODE_4115_length_5335_cov_9.417494_4_plen_400_part_00
MRYTGPDLHQGPRAESSRGDAREDDEAALGGAVSASDGAAAGGGPSASPVAWAPSPRRAARRAAARLSAEVLRALCRHAPHTLCSSQPRCLRQLLGWMAAGSAGSAGRQPDGQGPQRRRAEDIGGGGGDSRRADAESNRRFRCKVAVWCISTLFQSEPEGVAAFAIDRLLDVASAAQHRRRRSDVELARRGLRSRMLGRSLAWDGEAPAAADAGPLHSEHEDRLSAAAAGGTPRPRGGGGEQLRTMAEESVLRHLLQACCALAAPRDDDGGGDDDDDDDGRGPPGSGSGSRSHVRCGYRHRWDGRKVSSSDSVPELTERTLRLHICRRRELRGCSCARCLGGGGLSALRIYARDDRGLSLQHYISCVCACVPRPRPPRRPQTLLCEPPGLSPPHPAWRG